MAVNNKENKEKIHSKNVFIDDDLNENVNGMLYSLDELMEMANLTIYETIVIKYLFNVAKNLPASVRGYHGDYSGGLYDHVLLVTNIALDLFKRLKKPEFTKEEVIKSALYHDFEKLIRYAPKRKVQFNFKLKHNEGESIRYYLNDTYFLKGYDKHVEGSLALLKKLKIRTTENIEKAIIWHHGGWSYYKPHRTCGISALLHGADMLASQTLGV